MPEGMADHMYVRERYQTALKQVGSEKFPYDITKDMPMTAVTGAAQLVRKSSFEKSEDLMRNLSFAVVT